jgi:hypothetical protein
MSALAVNIDGILKPLAKSGRSGRTADDQPQAVRLSGYLSLGGLHVDNSPPVPPTPENPEGPDHIWGGGNEPFPTPPIANVPPITNPDPGREYEVKIKAIWSEDKGWQTVVVIVPSGDQPTVTPSSR